MGQQTQRLKQGELAEYTLLRPCAFKPKDIRTLEEIVEIREISCVVVDDLGDRNPAGNISSQDSRPLSFLGVVRYKQ